MIDRVLVLEGLRHEREAIALREGIRNALQIARDVCTSVYEDSES